MTQTMQLGKTGPYGFRPIDAKLVPVVAIARYQRPATSEPARTAQNLALVGRARGDRPCLPPLGPTLLQSQVVALVGLARGELDRLFPAPALDQGVDVLRLRGSGTHSPEAEGVKLVCDQTEQALPVALGGVAAVAVAPAQLFRLVVQVAHGVSLFR